MMILGEIVAGISRAINSEFGDKYKIYAESVEQGLEEPCFFIQSLTNDFKQELGNRYYWENLFCIQFFPEDLHNPSGECCDVSQRLFLCLEYIMIDGKPLRGIKMNCKIIDEVLNFFVNYNVFVHKGENENQPKMKKIYSSVTLDQ